MLLNFSRNQQFYFYWFFSYCFLCSWFLLLSSLFLFFYLTWVYFVLLFLLSQCGSLDYWVDTIPLFQYILIEIFSAINFSVLFCISVLIFCTFIFTQFNVFFKFLLRLLLWLIDYLEVYCLVSDYLEMFLLLWFLIWYFCC